MTEIFFLAARFERAVLFGEEGSVQLLGATVWTLAR